MDQIVDRPKKAKSASPETIEAVLAIDGNGKSRPRRRRWWVAAALAVAALAAAMAYSWFGQSAPQIVYRAAPVEKGSLTVEVSATGTLQPLTQVDVSSELSGVMRSVSVDENQRVAKGDVLAELDTTRIVAQIERARANVSASDARVADAEITLTETEQTLARTTRLAGRGAVTDQALETARAARDRAASAVAIAEANLEVARAELKLQEADLAKSTIYAPIDGIVLTRSVNPGQTVASSMSAPVLFVIAENLERMELKAAVDEADIGSVAPGQTARFTVDSFPARRFDAEIRDIAYASVVTEGVVTYEARLTVGNQELLLRPGMTATVDIVTREANDVLLVPSAAFRFSPAPAAQSRGFSIQSLFMPRMGPGRQRGAGARERGGAEGGRPLYVLRDGEPQMVRVTTGDTDGEHVEVLSGLSAGDQVILAATRR
ncbi:efflux RND transporter periplasmic adaptor subunit [Aquamicrobium sp. LC103]|uniref:efflux RND transporter periplasmic adaptor subunit n=1 Tax=Aquamicrobium sp. LC103 TaxID=1120658 RepID=UPI00063E9716|nr:efflux RND transporter periplasmic adaptor subunit [Aquamicrobium sp. LC103]TKT80077.1 efflux RND transporter periplasmic adaptor subunit [Aquamicrobium sp. LC103]